MARDDFGDDRDMRSTAKTSRAMQTTTHSASGGHTKGPGIRPGSRNQIIKPPLWDNAPERDSGGAMTGYQEYPKHVYPDAARPKHYVLVNSEAEEEAAMQTGTVVRDADEKRRLIAVGEVKDVPIDKRWSLERMTKAITDAGHDASLDPFK